MRSAVVFLLFLQEVTGQATELTVYVGNSITLPAGADPSWTLTKIDWSILSNSTLIATYHQKTVETDRFYRFKGRLTLNTTSGDLTINKLMKEDSMEYTVNLLNTASENDINKVRLTVIDHLLKPSIKEIEPSGSGCFVLLNCSSPDDDTTLSWEHQNLPLDVWYKSEGNPSQLMAFIRTKDPVEITCISTRKTEKTSNVFRPKCNEVTGQPTEVTGYIGEKVTLFTKADPSWTLTGVDWTIFSKSTLIATYRGGKIDAEHLDRYKGRLSLNKISGDLTINNLMEEDALEYTVDLSTGNQIKSNKIKLTVKCKNRSRWFTGFIIGWFVGLFVAFVMCCFRGHKEKACPCVRACITERGHPPRQ